MIAARSWESADGAAVVVVRQHVRLVDAGEGLVLRVLQQARGAHGERVRNRLEERVQVLRRLLGKRGRVEAAADRRVVVGLDREVSEVVLVEEPVEDVRCRGRRRTERRCSRSGKRPRTRLSSRSTLTNARPRALPPSEPPPRRENPEPSNVARSKSATMRRPRSARYSWIAWMSCRLRFSRPPKSATVRGRRRVGQRELGARLQPGREVVALAVIGEAGRGDRTEHLLQRLQVVRAAHLGAVGQPEDEVAEAEVLGDEVPELVEEHRRALELEGGSHLFGQRLVLAAARLQHDRDVRLLLRARGARARRRLVGRARRRAGTRCRR